MNKLQRAAFSYKLTFLKNVSQILFGNYRLVWPQLDWWLDQEFNSYLSRFNELEGFNTPRKWMLKQLLRLTEGVPGDTAECGVFKGASSYIICQQNSLQKAHKRIHHLFDSFEGLSAPSHKDGIHWKKGSMSAGEEIVAQNLSEFLDNVRFHKGWIPERFSDVIQSRFSFVHIDVDLYKPTFDSIAFFYGALNEGGVLLCDDYGFTTCPGATEAINEFLADKPEKMLSLDSGGGFFIKGVAVSSKVARGKREAR